MKRLTVVERGDPHVSLLATHLENWCLIIALLLRKAGSRLVQRYEQYIMYFILGSFPLVRKVYHIISSLIVSHLLVVVEMERGVGSLRTDVKGGC